MIFLFHSNKLRVRIVVADGSQHKSISGAPFDLMKRIGCQKNVPKPESHTGTEVFCHANRSTRYCQSVPSKNLQKRDNAHDIRVRVG